MAAGKSLIWSLQSLSLANSTACCSHTMPRQMHRPVSLRITVLISSLFDTLAAQKRHWKSLSQHQKHRSSLNTCMLVPLSAAFLTVPDPTQSLLKCPQDVRRYFDLNTEELGPACFRCGERGHTQYSCKNQRSKPVACALCAQFGHNKSQCPSCTYLLANHA